MAAWTARRALWLLVWSLLWSVSVQQDTTFSFVNPPPEDSSITDPSYTVGADINIEWVGPNDFVSVRLVHVLADDNVSEFTYVFSMQNHINSVTCAVLVTNAVSFSRKCHQSWWPVHLGDRAKRHEPHKLNRILLQHIR